MDKMTLVGIRDAMDAILAGAILKLYPVLGAAIVVTGAAGTHTLGAEAVIVAAAAIADDFVVDTVYVTAVSAGLGELVLYYGETDIEFARIVFGAAITIYLGSKIVIPGGSQITAKYATLAGTSQTCGIKIGYHLAP